MEFINGLQKIGINGLGKKMPAWFLLPIFAAGLWDKSLLK
jgi:hypothetical protein